MKRIKTKKTYETDVYFDTSTPPIPSLQPFEFKPKNRLQELLIRSLQNKSLVFTTGPAGTGKTFISAHFAINRLLEGKAKRIIVTRPVVEAEESLGFLPGEIEEKFSPYFAPIRDLFEDRLGASRVKTMLTHTHEIIVCPLAYMRGRSFKDSIMLLDEAQNTTPNQMKLFLTRTGEGSQVIVNGDINQKDIEGPSGLTDAIRLLGHLPQVAVVNFQIRDVVRSGLVQDIVDCYEGVD